MTTPMHVYFEIALRHDPLITDADGVALFFRDTVPSLSNEQQQAILDELVRRSDEQKPQVRNLTELLADALDGRLDLAPWNGNVLHFLEDRGGTVFLERLEGPRRSAIERLYLAWNPVFESDDDVARGLRLASWARDYRSFGVVAAFSRVLLSAGAILASSSTLAETSGGMDHTRQNALTIAGAVLSHLANLYPLINQAVVAASDLHASLQSALILLRAVDELRTPVLRELVVTTAEIPARARFLVDVLDHMGASVSWSFEPPVDGWQSELAAIEASLGVEPFYQTLRRACEIIKTVNRPAYPRWANIFVKWLALYADRSDIIDLETELLASGALPAYELIASFLLILKDEILPDRLSAVLVSQGFQGQSSQWQSL